MKHNSRKALLKRAAPFCFLKLTWLFYLDGESALLLVDGRFERSTRVLGERFIVLLEEVKIVGLATVDTVIRIV